MYISRNFVNVTLFVTSYLISCIPSVYPIKKYFDTFLNLILNDISITSTELPSIELYKKRSDSVKSFGSIKKMTAFQILVSEKNPLILFRIFTLAGFRLTYLWDQ